MSKLVAYRSKGVNLSAQHDGLSVKTDGFRSITDGFLAKTDAYASIPVGNRWKRVDFVSIPDGFASIPARIKSA